MAQRDIDILKTLISSKVDDFDDAIFQRAIYRAKRKVMANFNLTEDDDIEAELDEPTVLDIYKYLKAASWLLNEKKKKKNIKRLNIEQECRTLWTNQLYKEYNRICYYYGLTLTCPLIEIVDKKSILGSWNEETRCLSIVYRLIKNYSWDIVVEILKHEMAHQIVSEVFKSKDLHGDMFHKACQMLAVEDWAVKASGSLKQPIPNWREEEEKADTTNGMIRKVEKLLSLATSSNEQEASLAMQRAQEICTKYNIEQLGKDPDFVCLVIDRKKKRREAFEKRIASILSNYYFVQKQNLKLNILIFMMAFNN